MTRFRLVICGPLLISGLAACQLEVPSATTPDSLTFAAVGTDAQLEFQGPEAPFRFETTAHPEISVGRAVGINQGHLSADQPFVPASITKLFTAAVALKIKGPDFRFRTQMRWRQEGHVARDLTIEADGDPLTTKNFLRRLAEKLRDHGVSRIDGPLNLVSADPRRDLAPPAYGLDPEDYLNCYAARAQNFNLARNCATLEIREKDGSSRWSEASLRFPFLWLTDDKSRFQIEPRYKGAIPTLVGYSLRGRPRRDRVRGLAIGAVKTWYAEAFREALRSAEMQVDDSPPIFDRDVDHNASFTHFSPPLRDLVRRMNKESDNFLAEALYKSVIEADTLTHPNHAAARVARQQIAAWLDAEYASESSREITLYEGAGLSRANQVTPRAFLHLLNAISREPFFDVLWDSLPIAGRDGTLKNRMRQSEAAGLVRAKTGTLRGAYQLAGYIPRLDDQGRNLGYVPFVILTDTTKAMSGSARAFQDKIVNELVKQINPRLPRD